MTTHYYVSKNVVLQNQRPIKQTVYQIVCPSENLDGFETIIAEAYSPERASQVADALNAAGKAAAVLGSIRSEAKAASSRENGKKGGRPRKADEIVPVLDIDQKLGEPDHHGRMERRVIAHLLDHIQQGGFEIVGVNDGDELTKTTTIKAAMELIFNLDDAYIIVKKNHSRHTIMIVLGNDEPIDIIADWTFTDGDPDGFNALMEKFDPEKYA